MNISFSWLSEYFLHLSLFQVFFFKAQYKTGDIELSGEYIDHVWVTKEEMETYVDPDFYKVVKRFVYWWETLRIKSAFPQLKIDTVKETCPERDVCSWSFIAVVDQRMICTNLQKTLWKLYK